MDANKHSQLLKQLMNLTRLQVGDKMKLEDDKTLGVDKETFYRDVMRFMGKQSRELTVHNLSTIIYTTCSIANDDIAFRDIIMNCGFIKGVHRGIERLTVTYRNDIQMVKQLININNSLYDSIVTWTMEVDAKRRSTEEEKEDRKIKEEMTPPLCRSNSNSRACCFY